MLKVGDKVVLSNGKNWSKSQKYRTIKKVFKDGYLLEGDALKYGIEELKLYKENNMKELTFKEVITNIKKGEVWKSIFKTVKLHENGDIEIKNIDGDKVDSMLLSEDNLFTLQERKEYTFEEAFKYFENGMEIESCIDKTRFKIGHRYAVKVIWCFNYQEEVRSYKDSYEDDKTIFNLQQIRGKWYVND